MTDETPTFSEMLWGDDIASFDWFREIEQDEDAALMVGKKIRDGLRTRLESMGVTELKKMTELYEEEL